MVIRLPAHIWPTAFTVWHISEAVSPSGEVSSAPREFTVFVSLCLVLLTEGRPEGKAIPEMCFLWQFLSGICLGLAAAEHPIPYGYVGVLCLWGLLLCFMPKDPGACAQSPLTQNHPKLC